MPPGHTAASTTQSPTALSQPALEQITEGKALIYIFATVSYKDIFGHPHHTELCAFYKPADKSFSPCHEHNKSD